MPASGLTGFRLKCSVERRRLLVYLCHAQSTNEMGNEARRMPSRPGGELPFFNQNNVVPAFFGQSVEQPSTERTAANNHNPCMLIHFLTPFLLTLIRPALPDQ